MTVLEDICAIRGFHYYRRYWKLFLGENLICLHDKGNPFDVFAIKACSSGEIVGHLPREISRATKFLHYRGAEVKAEVSANTTGVLLLSKVGLKYLASYLLKFLQPP